MALYLSKCKTQGKTANENISLTKSVIVNDLQEIVYLSLWVKRIPTIGTFWWWKYFGNKNICTRWTMLCTAQCRQEYCWKWNQHCHNAVQKSQWLLFSLLPYRLSRFVIFSPTYGIFISVWLRKMVRYLFNIVFNQKYVRTQLLTLQKSVTKVDWAMSKFLFFNWL